MHFLSRLCSFVVIITALASLIAGVTPHRVAAADSPTSEVQPIEGYPGTQFHFSANGFNRGEGVSYWVNTPDQQVYSERDYSLRARRDGSVTWNWSAPTDAMSGTWSMVIEGIQSKVHHVILFEIHDGTVVDPATGFVILPDDSRLGVIPESGHGGTQFHFFASNFRQNENISFWVNDPDGHIYGEDSSVYQVRANGQGLADWVWVSSFNDKNGSWSMVAVGQESHVVQIIPFRIE